MFFSTDANGVRLDSGRGAWTQGHIPGSGSPISCRTSRTRRASPLPFMMPPAAQFAEAMSRYGVGEGTHVVLYDACSDLWAHMWATRVWWMLRVCGFEQTAVLNGGWHKWTMEGRPVSTETSPHPAAAFTARPRPALMADKREVLATIGDGHQCCSTRSRLRIRGDCGAIRARRPHFLECQCPDGRAHRPGHPHAYLPAAQLRAQFEAVGGAQS